MWTAVAGGALLAAAGCGGPALPTAGHGSRHLAVAASPAGPTGSPAGAAATGEQGTPTGSAAVPGSAASTAATAALTRYLSAIVDADAGALVASADQGPLAMGGVLVDTAAINRARGGTTTVTEGPSTLAPVAVTAAGVVFDGALTLTTTIAGSQGSGTFTDTLSGPLTVTDEQGTWRVTGFTYDGRAVQAWTEHASQTVNGLHVDVGTVVSYGAVTAVLVTLGQVSGSAAVQLQRCTLAPAGGQAVSGFGDFTAPPRPTGVLRFARVAGTPGALSLDFVSAAGQADDFLFSLAAG